MNTRSILLAGACALLLTACAAPQPADAGASPAVQGLAGSSWRLQEIQSMDDAQGTTRPQPDRLYTLRFTADGNAQLQLDCNRANTRFTQTPAESASGALSFGALAMTRAMCPAGSLDSRISRDLEHVRTYRLQNDRLVMSLAADGGIHVWTREASGSTPP